MRNFASCYNEHAVKVSDSSRSCSGGGGVSVRSSSSTTTTSSSKSTRDVPFFHSSTTCVYRTKLSSSSPPKELLITVTWSRGLVGQGLCITVDDEEAASAAATTTTPVLRKKKGSCNFFSGDTEIGLYWDISSAKYGPGPEPLEGFYVVVTAEDEFALLLGDMSMDQVRRFDAASAAAPPPIISDFWLVSRREQVMGNSLYSTKARFGDSGRDHEILIRCREGEAPKDSELSVCIDRKKVVHVRRLKWNFRGNQTIFVDGLPVDMMWDVHDWWWFTGVRGGGSSTIAAAAAPSPPAAAPGHAVFMFRTRSALESRLWLDEEWEQQSREDGKPGFSLFIHAFRSQP